MATSSTAPATAHRASQMLAELIPKSTALLSTGGQLQDTPFVGRVALSRPSEALSLDDFSPEDQDASHDAVLEASSKQLLLFKTVINEGWVDMVLELQGPGRRTSTSLPPANGKGMRLFGSPATYSVGLIWDYSKMDLSKAFCWPCGYFAKSDHNVDGQGRLLNGRQEALVSLEDLVDANNRMEYRHQLTGEVVKASTLPYNEVFTFVQGEGALAGLFTRSTEVLHILWAMGLRALLQRTIPGIGDIPLFVQDPSTGLRPINRSAQQQAVQIYLSGPASPSGLEGDSPSSSSIAASLGLPMLPLEAYGLDLSLRDLLRLQGRFGLTAESLSAVLDNLDVDPEAAVGELLESHPLVKLTRRHLPTLRPELSRLALAVGLQQAVISRNASAAMTLLHFLAPALYGISSVTTPQQTCFATQPVTSGRSTSSNNKSINDSNSSNKKNTSNNSSNSSSSSSDGSSEFSEFLHKLCSGCASRRVLIALGSLIALEDFSSGRMLPRIVAACRELEDWLSHSDSMFYRLGSWRELASHAGPGHEATVGAFLTRHSVENRRRFHDELLELEHYEEAHDAMHGMEHLRRLVDHLHHPCLRLELLQNILGLDQRFDVAAVAEVSALALSILTSRPGESMPTVEDLPILPSQPQLKATAKLEAVACHLQGIPHAEVDRGSMVATA